MRPFLIAGFLFICSHTILQAQPTVNSGRHASDNFEYYICISGVNSRQDVLQLEDFISKKPGVIFFMANRYPARYFLLKADQILTITTFSQWLINKPYHIDFFGAGIKGREQAVSLYYKNKVHK